VLAALREPGLLPLATWTDFTGGSTTAEDIRNAAFLVTVKTVDDQSGGIGFLAGLRETERKRRQAWDVNDIPAHGDVPDPLV
jgi:hypothetical protein